MRKKFLIVFFVFSITFPSTTAATSVDGIEIIDYGIYKGQLMAFTKEDKLSNGRLGFLNLNTFELSEKTEQIPAILGTRFGLRYIVKGIPRDDNVTITIRMITPGLKNPMKNKLRYFEEWTSLKNIGKVTADLFTFDEEWEIIPGRWTIQIFYRDRKLAEKTFVVYKSSDKWNAIEKTIKNLKSKSSNIRLKAVRNLGVLRNPRTIEYLIEVFDDPIKEVREGALQAIENIGPPALPYLSAALTEGKSENIRMYSAEGLRRIGDFRAARPLISALNDNSEKVRAKAKLALDQLKENPAIRIDLSFYKKAESADTVRAYKHYLLTFPRGALTQTALEQIETLEFEFYTKVNTLWGFRHFLKTYPDTRYKKEINKRIEEIRYRQIINEDEMSSYKHFLSEFPIGKYAQEIQNKLTALQQEESIYKEFTKEHKIG